MEQSAFGQCRPAFGRVKFFAQRRAPDALSDEQFKRLKAELEESYQGAVNAGRPFLLEGGLKWQQIALSPQDMEFTNSKNVSAREIALAFGVPPMILGIPGDNTYANYAEANRALWRLTLLPLLEKMCSGLNTWLTPRFGADLKLGFDQDKIPALTFERDALWNRIGLAPFLTPNEKRKMLGFEPVEGGDQVMRPILSAQSEVKKKTRKKFETKALQLIPEAERLEIEPRFKVWRTVLDDHTRDSHVLANGQVRFVGEPFLVGDTSLSEPRDPDGPPAETFNCRCLKEEYTLSDLPAEFLAQVEGRLTPTQRMLLRRGIRVAQAGEGEALIRSRSPKGKGSLPRVNLTLEEFEEAIKNGLFENAPLSPESISSNEEVEAQRARVNALSTSNNEDVLDDPRVNDFLKVIARDIAKAKINLANDIIKKLPRDITNKKEAGEKVFSLGLDDKGNIIVQGVMVFPGQGGNILPIVYPDTIAVVHVHFRELEQKPHGADNDPVKSLGIPNYVISHDGFNLWAVGRINDTFSFRNLRFKKPGRWQPFPTN